MVPNQDNVLFLEKVVINLYCIEASLEAVVLLLNIRVVLHVMIEHVIVTRHSLAL